LRQVSVAHKNKKVHFAKLYSIQKEREIREEKEKEKEKKRRKTKRGDNKEKGLVCVRV